MVAAGKEAAITRATGSYTFEEHTKNIDNRLRDILNEMQKLVEEHKNEIIKEWKKYFSIS